MNIKQEVEEDEKEGGGEEVETEERWRKLEEKKTNIKRGGG